MMILVMIIIIVIIIAIMITMIKMILIIAVVMIIKAQFNQVIFPRAPPLKPRVLLKPQNSTTKKAKSIWQRRCAPAKFSKIKISRGDQSVQTQ